MESVKVEDHLGLVKFMINRCFYDNSIQYEYDDLYQIGCIGLIKASKKFKQGKTKFSTYACSLIKYEILNTMKRDKYYPAASETDRLKGNYIKTLSLDYPVNELETMYSFLVDNSLDDIDQKLYTDEILKCLTPKSIKILKQYFCEDISQTEIAKEYNVTRQNISRIIKQSKDRIKRGVC